MPERNKFEAGSNEPIEATPKKSAGGFPGSSVDEVVYYGENSIPVQALTPKNIQDLLTKLLIKSANSSEEIVKKSKGGELIDNNFAGSVLGKEAKIKEDIDKLRNTFSQVNNKIFLVPGKIPGLTEVPDLSLIIIESQAENLKSKLKGYTISQDGKRGFWAKSDNITMYFLYGKEQATKNGKKKKKNQTEIEPKEKKLAA